MSSLPSYLAAAKPVPVANRAPWYKTIAPTYAGIMLWFVFWAESVKGEGTPGGVLSAGLGPALLGLVLAALICHFFYYLVPGLFGVKTGFPLYVVGTSTYGAKGGLFMPGLLMGLLQFGWLAVNAFAVAKVLCECLNIGMRVLPTGAKEVIVPGVAHGILATAFAVIAAFIALKGIQYVARVATYLPLIPLVVMVILLAKTCGGLGSFNADKVVAAKPPQVATEVTAKAETAVGAIPAPLNAWQVIGVMCIYVVGFFATAGAAGTDIASNARNESDVHWGGLVGIALTTIIASGAAMLIIAGAYGSNMVSPGNQGNLNPVTLMPDLLGSQLANVAMVGLAISSFPGACFSAFIAANSFKTTMPGVNPFVSVGLGTLITVILAVSGVVGKVIWVFVVIGASFGPVCGAMLADYLLSRGKWSGPRAGFNPAGWISWTVGFAVGAFNLVAGMIPALAAYQNAVPVPPVAAMVVGFVLYLVLALLGAQTRTLEMRSAAD
jgi:cytosine permease